MKHTIIRGTIILTLAGFLTRILGFFYRIFLAHHMAPERLGLYQLIAPVYGMCFTIYASGIQTAISGLVAEQGSKKDGPRQARRILFCGMLLSVLIALLLTIALYALSGQIATHILAEPETKRPLQIVSLMFPFCAVTACCNGYFYGCRKTTVPATAQLLEQISRIFFVLLCTGTVLSSFVIAETISCELAICGIVVGEVISAVCTLLLYLLTERTVVSQENIPSANIDRQYYRPLLRLAIPLTANHLVLNMLHSYETVLLPSLLERNGMSHSQALGSLGILTGMAMPFLFFPMALTSALSILLLPTIAEANARDDNRSMCTATALTIRYTTLMGFLFMGLFFLLGPQLCKLVFRSEEAGRSLQILAFFCPLLYMGQTIVSVLNGLGKTAVTFRNAVVSSSLRLVLVAIFIPKLGLNGFFLALGCDIVLSVLLSLTALRKNRIVFCGWWTALGKPLLVTVLILPFFAHLVAFTLHGVGSLLLMQMLLLSILYVACYLTILGLIRYPLRPGVG